VNLLFVCSRNKWRSLTAETVYKNQMGLNVKSAGTEDDARIRLNSKMITWADLIFVMEKKHKQRMQEKFSMEIEGKEIVILDIPDEYQYMDEELIEELKSKVDYYLNQYNDKKQTH